jgi:F-type H+-transporting ATPase subunit b
MELFSKLGIDWRILVFQIVNFSIVLLVLWRFLYHPLINFLETRKAKIDEGLVFARDMEKRLAEAGQEAERRISKAKDEAQSVLDRAVKSADKIKADLTTKAHAEAKNIAERATNDMRMEKEKILADIKKEVAGLVSSATRKVLEGEVDEKRAKNIVDKMLL